jgi:hypothetical protein
VKRGDYDYHHASTNAQFIVMVVLIIMCVLGGLTLGLTLLTSIL